MELNLKNCARPHITHVAQSLNIRTLTKNTLSEHACTHYTQSLKKHHTHIHNSLYTHIAPLTIQTLHMHCVYECACVCVNVCSVCECVQYVNVCVSVCANVYCVCKNVRIVCVCKNVCTVCVCKCSVCE